MSESNSIPIEVQPEKPKKRRKRSAVVEEQLSEVQNDPQPAESNDAEIEQPENQKGVEEEEKKQKEEKEEKQKRREISLNEAIQNVPAEELMRIGKWSNINQRLEKEDKLGTDIVYSFPKNRCERVNVVISRK